MQGGTLLQLRNLINRRNISADISGKFNEALDFFELVVVAHILAAAMHFFGMSTCTDSPSRNALPDTTHTTQWPVLRHAIERLVDRYVMVGGIAETPPSVQVKDHNPHAERIEREHNYAISLSGQNGPPQKRGRILPQWMQVLRDDSAATPSIKNDT